MPNSDIGLLTKIDKFYDSRNLYRLYRVETDNGNKFDVILLKNREEYEIFKLSAKLSGFHLNNSVILYAKFGIKLLLILDDFLDFCNLFNCKEVRRVI